MKLIWFVYCFSMSVCRLTVLGLPVSASVFALSMAGDSDTKNEVIKRIQGLFRYQTVETLQHVEKLMAERRVEPSAKARNPSGNKVAGPCRACGAPRPPAAGAAPWHLRDEIVPRGALCQPCEWASDKEGRDRKDWPHWQLWQDLLQKAKDEGKPLVIKIPPVVGRGQKRKQPDA